MTSKEEYCRLCESGDVYVPLFQQIWWLDTVCQGKKWDVLIYKDGGRILGALPYLYGKKLGLKYILQPQLTPWSGPWLHPDLDFEARQVALNALATDLQNQHAALCRLCFSPQMADWQPFHWHGFRQTTRYTYSFPSLADFEALYRSSSRIRRRYDKSVEEQCLVDPCLTLDEFVPFHVEYYQRRGERDLIGETLLRRVVSTACGHNQGLLWGLRRRDDNSLLAAWFVAYDEQCAWSLLLAIGKEAPNGAMSYLMWQMIKELSHRTQSFDFEGGMDANLAFFYRSFGTVQTPYHCIFRSCIPFGNRILGV